MTGIRDAALSAPVDDRARLAAAIRAVDAAMAACEAARLALVGVITPPVPEQVDPETCGHPVQLRRRVTTFGDVLVVCDGCGEFIDS